MEILKRIELQQNESKKMKDIIDYLVEQGVKTVYVRERIYLGNEIAESDTTIHLTKKGRNNYDKENEYNFTQNDYEIDILELKKELTHLTAVSVNNTKIIIDKYAKNNMENGKEIFFTEDQLNWSKDNISYFYLSYSLNSSVKRL